MRVAHKQAVRANLCRKYDGRCAYCNVKVGMRGTIDHYFPLALGGANDFDNFRWACLRCNGLKADMHPREWEQCRPALVVTAETPRERRIRLHQLIARRAKQWRGSS